MILVSDLFTTFANVTIGKRRVVFYLVMSANIGGEDFKSERNLWRAPK